MLKKVLLTAIIATIALTAPAAAETGLVGQWHLDNVVGSSPFRTPDSSGGGRDARFFTGAPVFVPGRFGNGLAFTGADDTDRLEVADTSALRPAALTVAMWVKRTGAPDVLNYLVAKGDQDPCNAASWGFYTGYFNADPALDNTGLQFYVANASGYTRTAKLGNDLWDGNWHAVAATYANGVARLWVDGVDKGTRSGTTPFDNGAPRYDGGPLVIGDYPSASCRGSFDGQMDEVRIYNRALSAAEIARLQDRTASSPPDTDAPPAPPPPPVVTPPVVTPPPTDPDADGDGTPASRDCDDANPAVHPGAVDVRGNALDEDCNGSRASFFSLDLSVVLNWDRLRSGATRFTSGSVEGVRTGDKLTISCSGRGCPKRLKGTRTLKKVKRRTVSITSRVRGVTLGPKAKLVITVSRTDTISRVTTYTMVKFKNPKKSTRCRAPGAKRTTSC